MEKLEKIRTTQYERLINISNNVQEGLVKNRKLLSPEICEKNIRTLFLCQLVISKLLLFVANYQKQVTNL